MEGDTDERTMALAEPYLCRGEQFVMHARVVREQAMRALLTPASAASSPALGLLIITNYALIFLAERTLNNKKRSTEDLWWNSLDIKVPLATISRVEAKKDKNLRIHCKDFRLLQFTMPYTLADPTNTKKQMELTLRKIDSTIRMFAFAGRLKNLFAFSHQMSLKEGKNGWEFANIRKDLERLRLPKDKWRISDANHSYLICPTYPSVFAVPNNVSDITLHKVGAFRSKGRIPILSWIHPKNDATITRAAQPLVGISGNRSSEDEHLIKEIIRANPLSALVIMDARPKVNAAANKARGAGYETMSNYAGEISGLSEDSIAVSEVDGIEGGVSQSGTLEFLGIDNIHVMRDSEKKLKEICNHLTPQDKSWLLSLDNTRWLDFVSLLLACTRRMVLTIEAGISIFTHCSDGWDRTSQLTALAMLCLDPYYRTMEGFATLIEREWLAAGHKFQQRYGHGDKHYDDSNRSPIFPQFIDCVYQLLHQFPTCFEFNEDFLITVLDALYSCQYGTFLCNSEKERMEAQLHTKTVSLWSYTEKHKTRFTSREYVPYDQVLVPQSLGKHLKFWSLYFDRYCRFNEQNPDKWFKQIVDAPASDRKSAKKSKKDKKHSKKQKSAAQDDGPDDILQHLAEREKWKKELLSREAEVKRMKKLAEKHMEMALRLKSRITHERRRATFYRDKLDQLTHQGGDRLEWEWENEWKRQLENGADDDEDDDILDLIDSETDNEADSSSQAKRAVANGDSDGKARKDRKKDEEEPDELVEFFIRSPTKQQPRKPTQSATSSSAVPSLPLNSVQPVSQPMPSPPSRRPPPLPGGGSVTPSPRTPSSASGRSGESGATPSVPSPKANQPGLARGLSQEAAPKQELPSTSLTSNPSGMSIHRQMGKKLVPLLMRRPTREDLVARKILLPQEEDILRELESGSIDTLSEGASESDTDDLSAASPRVSVSSGEVDDIAETADPTPLHLPARSPSPAQTPSSIPSPRSKPPPPTPSQVKPLSMPSPRGNAPSPVLPKPALPSFTRSPPSGQGSAAPLPSNIPDPGSGTGSLGRSFLSSSGSSSWMASQRGQPAATPAAAPAPRSQPGFSSAQHRNGSGSVIMPMTPAPTSQTTKEAPPAREIPKQGLVQRFVSEKNVKSSTLRGNRP